MVRLLNDFDPHVMIDLHTTNGSRHAYHLTYETPNNPAVDGAIVRQSRDVDGRGVAGGQDQGRLGLPLLRQRLGDGAEPGVDDRRGPAALHPQLLGDAQSLRHPGGDLLRTCRSPNASRPAGASSRKCSATRTPTPRPCGRRPTRPTRPRSSASACRCARRWRAAPAPIEILMGGVEEDVNPYSGRVMHKRTNVRTPEPMADETTFESTGQERVPTAYFVPAEQKGAVELLRAHGITLERGRRRRDAAARGVPGRRVDDDAEAVREPPGTHGDRQLRPGGARGAGRCLARADDPAPGAAGLLPARAGLQRRPGHVERARRGA